jgi:hypothetical protein
MLYVAALRFLFTCVVVLSKVELCKFRYSEMVIITDVGV